ncbi:unnamed protein product [Rotaria sp. Silwood1]|nr:unnamed protein product [Rotaria sp. Silwood1]
MQVITKQTCSEQLYLLRSQENGKPDESNSKLALCAGIKCFDRVIELNGLLICSPATYAHYKSKNKHIHSNLETVKVMKPVNDKHTAGNEQVRSGEYCAVRCEDNSGVTVVKQSAVRKPPNNIRLFEQRMVNRSSQYRNSQIILVGKQSEN